MVNPTIYQKVTKMTILYFAPIHVSFNILLFCNKTFFFLAKIIQNKAPLTFILLCSESFFTFPMQIGKALL